jgi:hypothetical protein
MSMIVLFHENILLSTYKFIVIPIKYRNFRTFVYDSAGKEMTNAISLVIEQRKNEYSPSICMPYEGDIIFRTPARIYF